MPSISMECHQNIILHRSFGFKTIENSPPDVCQMPLCKHSTMTAKCLCCFMPLLLIENLIGVHYTWGFYKQCYKALAGPERGNCPLTYKTQASALLIDNLEATFITWRLRSGSQFLPPGCCCIFDMRVFVTKSSLRPIPGRGL